MCGRYALSATPEEIQALFGYPDGDRFPPRYNIVPTQPIAVVRRAHGATRFALMRWGLVPSWVADPRQFPLLINLKTESATTKQGFRGAFQYRRCLAPASGFYEWRRGPGKGKQPYFLRPRKGGVVAFAGLWETWSGPDGGEIDTACVLTTDANAIVAPIHDRMPVTIAPADFPLWLGSTDAPLREVAALLRPPPDDLFEAVPVSDKVNAAENDGPGLIEPVAEMRTDLFG